MIINKKRSQRINYDNWNESEKLTTLYCSVCSLHTVKKSQGNNVKLIFQFWLNFKVVCCNLSVTRHDVRCCRLVKMSLSKNEIKKLEIQHFYLIFHPKMWVFWLIYRICCSVHVVDVCCRCIWQNYRGNFQNAIKLFKKYFFSLFITYF